MKKKIVLGAGLIIAILLIVSIALVTHSVGTKKYYSNILSSNIEIPKYAFGVDETTGEDTIVLMNIGLVNGL